MLCWHQIAERRDWQEKREAGCGDRKVEPDLNFSRRLNQFALVKLVWLWRVQSEGPPSSAWCDSVLLAQTPASKHSFNCWLRKVFLTNNKAATVIGLYLFTDRMTTKMIKNSNRGWQHSRWIKWQKGQTAGSYHATLWFVFKGPVSHIWYHLMIKKKWNYYYTCIKYCAALCPWPCCHVSFG